MISEAFLPSAFHSSTSALLSPILVAAYGRSGTTAVMNLLSTDPRVAFDREYPFENRHLSYYAKLASILGGSGPGGRFTPEHLLEFGDSSLGPRPWACRDGRNSTDWLRIFWSLFSCEARAAMLEARFYAEKAPWWLPAEIRGTLPSSTVYLFRDPRDVFLSANAFMGRRNYYGFHRTPADNDLDHARSLGWGWLHFFENWQWERERTDCLRFRYEDFVQQPEELLGWCRSKGLEPDLDRAFAHFEGHRTSGDLAKSVGRWRREGIRPEISGFFERHLGGEMEALGYPVERDPCPSVECGEGRPEPELTNPSHGRVELLKDAMAVHVEGDDFGILLPFAPFQAEEARELWVSAAGRVGSRFSIYWRGGEANFSEERAMHLDYAPSAHWRVVRFRVGQHPLWKGAIRKIRLDLFNSGSGECRGLGYVRWVRLIA
jgi:hypothetical protein